MDRDVILAAQRDALWVIALRAKLLRARSSKQAEDAGRASAQSRATVTRAAERQIVYGPRTLAAGRPKVVPLVRRSHARRS